jgi:hypothetical protein
MMDVYLDNYYREQTQTSATYKFQQSAVFFRVNRQHALPHFINKAKHTFSLVRRDS